MNAVQNLTLVCKIKGVAYDRIDETLELVGLLSRKHSPFKTYSLGMKQRLAIASALLNNPEILILDEPTNGLDPQGIRQIRDLIKHIAKSGTTILLASHLLDEVEKVCSHVIVLRQGNMLYQGRVDQMVQNHGSIFLSSENIAQLRSFLNEKSFVAELIEQDNLLEVKLSSPVTTAQINKEAFEKGIVLTELAFKKQSLEDQFLELTKN